MGHKQPDTLMQVTHAGQQFNRQKHCQQMGPTKMHQSHGHALPLAVRLQHQSKTNLCFYWHPGPMNYVDYWTKHHPAAHHQNMRPVFLTSFSKLLELRKMQPQTKCNLTMTQKSSVRSYHQHWSPLQGCVRHVIYIQSHSQ
jgi:hypothetical protein